MSQSCQFDYIAENWMKIKEARYATNEPSDPSKILGYDLFTNKLL